MIAPKPKSLSHIEAGAVPVRCSDRMANAFDYAEVKAGSRANSWCAGNVGAYACSWQKTGRECKPFATAGSADLDYVRGLGADTGHRLQGEQVEDFVGR